MLPKKYKGIAEILVLVGALNWGLHALGYNVVEMLLSSWPMAVSIAYYAVGISAALLAYDKYMK